MDDAQPQTRNPTGDTSSHARDIDRAHARATDLHIYQICKIDMVGYHAYKNIPIRSVPRSRQQRRDSVHGTNRGYAVRVAESTAAREESAGRPRHQKEFTAAFSVIAGRLFACLVGDALPVRTPCSCARTAISEAAGEGLSATRSCREHSPGMSGAQRGSSCCACTGARTAGRQRAGTADC
jgi:hypothetical protein